MECRFYQFISINLWPVMDVDIKKIINKLFNERLRFES